MQTLRYRFLKNEIAKVRESFTLPTKTIKHKIPDELQSSCDLQEEPSGIQNFGVQKLANLRIRF